MNEDFAFETERLWLRIPQLSDAPHFLKLLNSPDWIKNIGDRNIKTIEAAEHYILTKQLAQHNQYHYGSYSMFRKSDGAWIGTVGLYNREGLYVPDIGFALLSDYYGQGYAYEGAQKILETIPRKFEIRKIGAITLPSNASSIKLLEKLGLKYQKEIKVPNDDAVLNYYEVDLG